MNMYKTCNCNNRPSCPYSNSNSNNSSMSSNTSSVAVNSSNVATNFSGSNISSNQMLDSTNISVSGFNDPPIFPNNYMYGQSYVPIQYMSKTFKPSVGLQMGTIFPELVSPYYPCQNMQEIAFLQASGIGNNMTNNSTGFNLESNLIQMNNSVNQNSTNNQNRQINNSTNRNFNSALVSANVVEGGVEND